MPSCRRAGSARNQQLLFVNGQPAASYCSSFVRKVFHRSPQIPWLWSNGRHLGNRQLGIYPLSINKKRGKAQRSATRLRHPQVSAMRGEGRDLKISEERNP